MFIFNKIQYQIFSNVKNLHSTIHRAKNIYQRTKNVFRRHCTSRRPSQSFSKRNETAAHIIENQRMTIMFCAFAGNPLILRLYGTAKFYQPNDAEWADLIDEFPKLAGARQIFDMTIETVQTSCGYAVPLYDFDEQRTRLEKWASEKGESGIQEYWEAKNKISIDGKETGM